MRTNRPGWNRASAITLSGALVLSAWATAGGCASGSSAGTGQADAVMSAATQPDDTGEQVLKVVATAGVVVLYVFAAACGAAGSGSFSFGGSSCSH